MQFLYYLLIFFVIVSAIIAVLIASGILHIEVYNDSNADNLPEDVRKQLDEESEEVNHE